MRKRAAGFVGRTETLRAGARQANKKPAGHGGPPRSNANGFTLWHFTTDDAASEIERLGYFNEAAGMFRPGDIIFAKIQRKPGTVTSLILSIARIDRGQVECEIPGKPEPPG